MAELAANLPRAGVNSDYEEGCYYKIEIPIKRFFRYFFLRYSVFFGIWNTDFGIGNSILKYLGIRYRYYRLPTQD